MYGTSAGRIRRPVGYGQQFPGIVPNLAPMPPPFPKPQNGIIGDEINGVENEEEVKIVAATILNGISVTPSSKLTLSRRGGAIKPLKSCLRKFPNSMSKIKANRPRSVRTRVRTASRSRVDTPLVSPYKVLPAIPKTADKKIVTWDEDLVMSVLTGNPDCNPEQEPSKMVRIYVSSLYQDMAAERNYLFEHAYPELLSYCTEKGLEFKYVDLSLGVSEMNMSENAVTELIDHEIGECQRLSCGPAYVLMIGDSTGVEKMPRYLEADDLDMLHHITKKEALDPEDQIFSSYQKDENDIPPKAVLSPVLNITLENEKIDLNEVLSDIKNLILTKWKEQEPHLVQRVKKALKYAVQENVMEDEKAQRFIKTELEDDVREGILNNSNAKVQCLCYEKNAPNIVKEENAASEKTTTEYGTTHTRTYGHTSKTMVPKKTYTDLSPTERTAKIKLEVIRKVGMQNCGSFTTNATKVEEIVEDTEYLEEMKEKFVKDVKRMIDMSAEKQTTQFQATPLYQEALRHMRMCNRILDETVSNDESVLRVRHALFGNRDTANKPVIVFGGNECGKSCILAKVANYARYWMGADCVTVMRFLNISTESSNSVNMLRSIIDQITTVYGLEKPPDYPSRNSYKLGVQLRWAMDIVARTCRNPLMIVIDGIDELDEPEEKKLAWFPNTTPGNDRVALVTSVNSSSKEILEDLADIVNCRESFIKLDDTLSELAADETLTQYLEDHQRTLTYSQKDFFIDMFQKVPNPLFLKIWLERAKTWKSTEIPTPLISADADDTLAEVLTEFFSRLQKSLGSVFTKFAAGYLTLSSHGLTEVELEDVLSCNNEVLREVYNGIETPSKTAIRVPPLYVARFLHGLKNFLKEKYIDGIRVVTWLHQSFPSVYLTELPGIDPDRLHADLAEIYEVETDVVKNVSLDNPPRFYENVRRLVRPQPLVPSNVRKLSALPYHMLLQTAEKSDELLAIKEKLFNNLKWLMVKIEAYTIEGVLEDVKMALDYKSDEDTRELYQVLRQAADSIRGNKEAFPMEVVSRLRPRGSYEKLYHQCVEYIRQQGKAQLLPLYPSLPGNREILVDSVPGCCKMIDALEEEGLIAMKGENGVVSVYSIETNEFTHHMENQPDPGQKVLSEVSLDKQRMMSLIGQNLRLWNFKSGASIKEFEIENPDDDVIYTCLDVTKDGTTALLGTNRGGLVLVDSKLESVRISKAVHSGKVWRAYYTDDFSRIISVGEEEDLIINIWLVKTLEVFKTIKLPSRRIKNIPFFIADEERCVCACANYTVIVASIKSGEIIHDLPVISGMKMMTSMRIDEGRHAVTGGEDDVIRIWCLEEGKMEREIQTFASNCTCVGITYDGEYCSAAFDNPRVMKIYHVSSGDCLKEIKAIRDRVTFITSFRFDHKTYLLSVFTSSIVDVWDIANMFKKPDEVPVIKKLKAEDHIDPDIHQVNDLDPPKSPRSPLPPPLPKIYPETSVDDVMVAMVISGSGDHIITTSSSSKPKIWDVMTGLLVREVNATTTVKDIRPCVLDTALVGMQELINDFGVSYVLKMWDFQHGEPLDLDTEDIYVSAFCVSPDTMTAWVGNTAPIGPVIALSCFDLVEKRMLRHVVDDQHNLGFLNPLSVSLRMHQAVVSPDGKIAITCSEDATSSHSYIHTVNLLDRTSPALRVAGVGAKLHDQIHVVTKNYEIITGTSKGEIVIWNGFYFHILRTLTAEGKDNVIGMNYVRYWDDERSSYNAPHSGRITDIRLTEDERHLVAASTDTTITLWDMKCNSFLRRLVGHEDEVWCADISTDTLLVVSGSRDGSIRLWKFETGEVLSRFNVHTDVFNIRLAKDNTRVVARGDKKLTGKLFIFEILNLQKALERKPASREKTTLSRVPTNVTFASDVSEEEAK